MYQSRTSKAHSGSIVSIPAGHNFLLKIRPDLKSKFCGGDSDCHILMKLRRGKRLKGVIAIKGVVPDFNERDWELTAAMASLQYTAGSLFRNTNALATLYGEGEFLIIMHSYVLYKSM